jgi:hypothetical protein
MKIVELEPSCSMRTVIDRQAWRSQSSLFAILRTLLIQHSYLINQSGDSLVNIMTTLQARPWVWFQAGPSYPNVLTVSGTHPSLYSVRAGCSFHDDKAVGAWNCILTSISFPSLCLHGTWTHFSLPLPHCQSHEWLIVVLVSVCRKCTLVQFYFHMMKI